MINVDEDWFSQQLRDIESRKGSREIVTRELLGRSTTTKPSRTPDVVEEMRQIREQVRNLARVHGVPPQTHVEIAAVGQSGAGASGFRDAPHSFDQPYMLLDKQAYQTCRREVVHSTYLGIGNHEASHLLYTREFFKRWAGRPPVQRKVWENLLEDARIEDLSRRESPGFGVYLDIMLEELFDRQELGSAVANWAILPDMDKVHALIFAFVRRPNMITPEMREWAAINGERVFDSIRTTLHCAPRKEQDVDNAGARIDEMVERMRALYRASRYDQPLSKDGDGRPMATEPDGRKTCGEGTAHCAQDLPERVAAQLRADAEDREFYVRFPGPAPSEDGLAAAESLRERAERLLVAGADLDLSDDIPSRWLDLAAILEKEGDDFLANVTLDEACRQEYYRERSRAVASRCGLRFGRLEMDHLLDRFSSTACPLDLAETQELADAERERVTLRDAWDWDTGRKTVIRHPLPELVARGKFDEAKRVIRGHIAAMRRVLQLRLGTRTWREVDLAEGRIHARMLGRSIVNQRIFCRSRTRRARGIALCLLLDESGSMGTCEIPAEVSGQGSAAAAALQVAVLMSESLRGVPGVELEIYSHSSCGDDDRDCLLRYLYGRCNPDPHSIGAYGNGRENYDHQAILTAARLFQENTTNQERILIVVTDGAPSGQSYNGEPAVRATREAVEHVRRTGTKVLAVAIDDYGAEEIYGAPHVLHSRMLPGRFRTSSR